MNNTNSAILGSGDHVLIYSAASKLENGRTLVNLVKKGAETVERGWERLCESLERNGDYDYDDDYIGEEEDEAAFADPDYPF